MDKRTAYLLSLHKRQNPGTKAVKPKADTVRKPLYKRNMKVKAMLLDENRVELSDDRAYRGQSVQYSTAPDRMYKAPKDSVTRKAAERRMARERSRVSS